MKMIKIFTIPFSKSSETFFEDEPNQFLLNKKVNSIKAEFFKNRENFYWTVFIDCDTVIAESKDKKEKGIDKQDQPHIKLDEKDELLLKRLKEWRKQRAEKEGIPVYIIANNKELLAIVQSKPKSKEALKQIKGYGKKKIEKYGDDVLKIISGFLP
jgi:superfamily II DNA helicase RecQ